MARSNLWENVAVLAGSAALAGAGIGAASALMFAERRLGALDRQLDVLEGRVANLERLSDRVTRLETDLTVPAPRREAG